MPKVAKSESALVFTGSYFDETAHTPLLNTPCQELLVSVDHNRTVVRAIIAALANRDIETVLSHMHEEGLWSVPYRTDCFPYGIKTKIEFGQRAGAFLATFSEFDMQIQSIITEGDRVAVEATSVGVGPGGENYANIYHMSFVMRDGMAYNVLEFFDPFPALEYLEQLKRASIQLVAEHG